MNNDITQKFCSSYCREASVRLVIRGKKLFFLRKSKPLRGKNLVGVSSDGYNKQIVLKPDEEGGYNLCILPHANQVISLCSHIPGTNHYSSYLRIPISVNIRGACFRNTPAYVYNMNKLKKIATDKAYLQYCVKATDYFQSDRNQTATHHMSWLCKPLCLITASNEYTSSRVGMLFS